MRILAYEFITGGGLAAQSLPAAMTREADLMLVALAGDLARIADVEVSVARDPRLAPPPLRANVVRPRAGESPFDHYARALAQVDAVWPVAPETGGVLAELTRLALEQRKTLLGSRLEAVQAAASKLRSARLLEAAAIPTIRTYADPAQIPDLPGAWVVKPDDGAGCADTLYVATVDEARAWLRARRGESFIAQPWTDGEAMSLSLLCRDGEARLICCNRQHVSIDGGRLTLEGITVNVPCAARDAMAALAGEIARALPGLWGYVGVDLIARPDALVVVEINPRLTTSYCGLGPALGANPAALVLDLLQGGALPDPFAPHGDDADPAPVKIVLESAHAA
jgi:predicted ATP-grasp superfamily ATP-dependent carboligase